MKVFVFLVVVICVAGLLFWGDLFNGEPEKGTPGIEDRPIKVVVPDVDPTPVDAEASETGDYRALVKAGKWEEALKALDRGPETGNRVEILYGKHLCLIRLERHAEGEGVLREMMEQHRASPLTVVAAIDFAESAPASNAEKRRLLSAVSDGLGGLSGNDADRLVELMKELNSHGPGSLQGLYPSEKYTVAPNDSLWEICNRYRKDRGQHLESGLLRILNGLKGNTIYPGQELNIPKQELSIKVWRQNWLMGVFMGDMLLSAYRVGLGKDGSTPGGEFVIMTRLKNPDWNSEGHGRIIPYGDPLNILGTRWLGFENRSNARGLGIHGTTSPESIGRNESAGCIRLINQDLEELFEIVARGITVTVI